MKPVAKIVPRRAALTNLRECLKRHLCIMKHHEFTGMADSDAGRKGMRYMNSDRRCVLFVEFKVLIPTKLTEAQKECLKQFEAAAPEEEKSFWAKLFG